MSGQLEKDDEIQGSEPSRAEVIEKLSKDFSSGKSAEQVADHASGRNKPPAGTEKPAAAGTAEPAGKPGGQEAGASDKPRDETGKFAPKPDPFAGFSELDPKVQKEFKRLLGEKEQLNNNYNSLMGQVPAMRREVQNLRNQLAKPQTAEQQTKVQASLDKFEAFKARYPEDAEGVQQLVDSIRQEVTAKLAPPPELTEKVAQLQDKVSEYERERQIAAAQREADRLAEDHPEWKVIAGWEDDNGNPVPTEKQTWHPWFTAWMSGLHPDVRANYDHLLKQPNAALLSHVFSQFKRDVQAQVDASGQQQADASDEQLDATQRRSDALRDISPRPSRSGSEPIAPSFSNGRELSRDAILAQYYDKFRSGAKLR